MSTSPTQKRFQSTFRADIPLLLWLVVVWGALWGDWRLGNLVFGLILAFIVTRALTLPPIELSGRFNVLHFAVFVVSFIWQVATASFHVFKLALVQGPAVQNAVVDALLTGSSPFDDLPALSGQLTTAQAMAANLVPRLQAAGMRFEVL